MFHGIFKSIFADFTSYYHIYFIWLWLDLSLCNFIAVQKSTVLHIFELADVNNVYCKIELVYCHFVLNFVLFTFSLISYC